MASKPDKFQLPEFTPINFSLTDGTDIPPPLPESPKDDDAQPPSAGLGPLSSHPTTPRIGAFPSDTLAEGGVEAAAAALERAVTNEPPTLPSPPKPTSPTTSKRPSSVRRFLGMRTLNSTDSLHSDFSPKNRPMSPQSVSTQISATDSTRTLTRKKSTGWFGKRKSMMVITKVDEQPVDITNGHHNHHHHHQQQQQQQQQYQHHPSAPQRKGPPPPSIPEFVSLGAVLDGGDLGADDMFKHIK